MNLSTLGDYVSIVGFIISIITLVYAWFIKNEVNKLQMRNLFDKRINNHLSKIDMIQSELISYIDNVENREIRIKEIFIIILTQFESIYPKLADSKSKRKIKRTIRKINRIKNKSLFNSVVNDDKPGIKEKIEYFFKDRLHDKISTKCILSLYVDVNENYNRIEQLKIDKKKYI